MLICSTQGNSLFIDCYQALLVTEIRLEGPGNKVDCIEDIFWIKPTDTDWYCLPQICDMGSARSMEHTAKMTTAVGTYAWMAPEVRYRVLYP